MMADANAKSSRSLWIALAVTVVVLARFVLVLGSGAYRAPTVWLAVLFINLTVFCFNLRTYIDRNGGARFVLALMTAALGAVAATYLWMVVSEALAMGSLRV